MRGSRWLAVAIAVGSVSTSVAIARSGSSETVQVLGTFDAKLVKQKEPRRCDSKHSKFELEFKGYQRSNDERLEGKLEIESKSVRNTRSGWGYSEGTVTVRSERRHRTKFRGEFVAVVEPDGGAEGFLTGRTYGDKSVRLFANFNVDQDPATGAISGEFGQDNQEQKPYAPTEDQDPAILTNACLDKHDRD